MLLKDKVIIVTGAAMGMGKATAEVLVDYGAKVVVADFNEEEGKKVADELNKKGEALFISVNVSKEDEVKAMVEKTVEHFGRLDGALNNAALTPDDKKIDQMDMSYYDRLMDVDLRGVILCMKYELQQFLKQGDGGSIVDTSSVSGIRPQPGNPAYVAAKHAVIGITKQAAMDYGEYNIRVNSVAPGAINTPMLQNALVQFGFDPVEYAKQLSMLNRFGEAKEIAEANAWLLSDKASYVTGAVLTADGGYTAM